MAQLHRCLSIKKPLKSKASTVASVANNFSYLPPCRWQYDWHRATKTHPLPTHEAMSPPEETRTDSQGKNRVKPIENTYGGRFVRHCLLPTSMQRRKWGGRRSANRRVHRFSGQKGRTRCCRWRGRTRSTSEAVRTSVQTGLSATGPSPFSALKAATRRPVATFTR